MTTDEMREPTFLVLSALTDGPRHGYAVMHEVEVMSHGRVQLRTSTLYAVLERLLSDGLIRETRQEIVEGRLRRYYEVTDPGVERLRVEVDRLQVKAREAARRLRVRARMVTA